MLARHFRLAEVWQFNRQAVVVSPQVFPQTLFNCPAGRDKLVPEPQEITEERMPLFIGG